MRPRKQYASVVVDVTNRRVNRPFDYEIPEALVDSIQLGHRVFVPFGRRRVTGYVVGFPPEPGVSATREIHGLVDAKPLLTPEQVELARWMAQRYQCLLIDGIRAMVPAGIHITAVRALRLTDAAAAGDIPKDIADGANQLLEYLKEHPDGIVHSELVNQGPAIAELLQRDLVRWDYLWLDPKVKPKLVNRCWLADGVDDVEGVIAQLAVKAPKQAQVMRVLATNDGRYSPTELARRAETTHATVTALKNKGLVKVTPQEERRDPYSHRHFHRPPEVTPNPWQQRALEELFASLDQSKGQTFLLHGVTGSGKTEVYLRLIERALQQRKTAICLVPEISLTPQTVRRFKERFGTDVAVLHSRLSLGERYDEWRRIRNQRVRVVVGARSAVFAPLTDLGVIVIDEEHETSYKQEESPRYHARDVAIFRAQITGATVVLGSATPSVESYWHSQQGAYTLLEMRERFDGRQLPPVEIVDMREEMKQGNRSMFSARLRSALEACLEEGNQGILLLNRRGFASFVLCRECGAVLGCPNCRVSLTLHHLENSVVCHYCGHHELLPSHCPECGGKYLRPFGAGTERVTAELAKEFPQARILRMDVDTTRTKGAHERILGQFERRQADFLVGTQMIAKGLDFPGVSLVGVVTADTALNLPDFRAGERTFQLLTQVAGRAGRGGVPGEVVIQTYTPDHYSIIAAEGHDYELFVRQELEFRERLNYPPFTLLGRVLVSGPDERLTMQRAEEIAQRCRGWVQGGLGEGVEILGPAPAPLSKLKGRYRWHVLVKHPRRPELEDLFDMVNNGAYDREENLRVSVDIDPISLL